MAHRTHVIGLQFFAFAFALGIIELVVAPIGEIRLLSTFAIIGAVAGFALEWYALRLADPREHAALVRWLENAVTRLWRAVNRESWARRPAPHDAATGTG